MRTAAITSAASSVPLSTTEIAPIFCGERGSVVFADFGQAAYGTLQLHFPADPPLAHWRVRFGEKLGLDGAIDRTPPGSVNFRDLRLVTQPGQRTYHLEIPSKPFHQGAASVKMPPAIGEVTPFRYAEIEGAAGLLNQQHLRQVCVHAPFDDMASRFESSDHTLNAVWNVCKHTIKATTAFGVYIDGERERIPYEADAYLNQLSHYACDLDPRVARATFTYLLHHPTWPTEWRLHMPMIASADYEATGDPQLAREHFDALKATLQLEQVRGDGLLVASAIVDWPAAERDGYNDGVLDPGQPKQVGPHINTVANAFYYCALQQMAALARALHNEREAHDFGAQAEHVRTAFNRVFFDTERGVYLDGEGSRHASLHANMLPLAFDLVPRDHTASVAAFVESRGMACSVYGAQYLLEGMFAVGKDDYAIQLMTARTKRSWWHMLDLGSTMTLEAWDADYKPNLTWNHAWGAAPANIITRFVLGVRPLEAGYTRMLIAPQLGGLRWARGTVPTAVGSVTLAITNGVTFRLEVELPAGATACIRVPRRNRQHITMDGRTIAATAEGSKLVVEAVGEGRHVLELR